MAIKKQRQRDGNAINMSKYSEPKNENNKDDPRHCPSGSRESSPPRLQMIMESDLFLRKSSSIPEGGGGIKALRSCK